MTGDEIQQSVGTSVSEMGQDVSRFTAYIQEHIPDMITFGIRLAAAVLIFIAGRYIIRWIRKRVQHSFAKNGGDQGVAQFTDSILKFGLYVILIIIIAGNLGIKLSSITVMFASAGVGISLALQGVVSNFAGGILILMLKPFSVGDYIIEDTNKNEGTVKEIKIFYTKLTTLDNKTIVIPNGTLTNNSLTNVTAKAERQLDLKVGISYESDLKKAKALLEQLLKEHKSIRTEEDWRVFVDSLGDHAVILGVRAWVKTEDYWPARWELLEQIKLKFDEEGIEIPYNQVTVHMNESKEKF